MSVLVRPRAFARTLLCAALAATAIGGVCIAMDPPPETPAGNAPAAPQREGGREGQRRGGQSGSNQVSVEGAMKIMARAQRTLKDQLGDASKREENIALVIDMQRGCVLAKSQELPEGLLKPRGLGLPKTKAEVQALRETFAAGLRTLLRELIELEQSLVDNKLDAAARHFARVEELEDQTHAALGMKD